jgi:hypothetical protein
MPFVTEDGLICELRIGNKDGCGLLSRELITAEQFRKLQTGNILKRKKNGTDIFYTVTNRQRSGKKLSIDITEINPVPETAITLSF